MGEEKKEEEEEEDLSLAYAARGQGNTPDPVEFFLHFLKYFNISFLYQGTLAFFLSPLMFPGFARYPMVGYIYKVNSTSSEEIWLWRPWM